MTGKPQTRIYKNRWFAKFASREGISDAALVAAVEQADSGLIDADLGGGQSSEILQGCRRHNHSAEQAFWSIIKCDFAPKYPFDHLLD